MTTPSAYRMATTVVPCVTPAGGSPPPPPPSTDTSVPTRFNNSLKLGPGSPDGNSGRLIRRETLPAAKNYGTEGVAGNGSRRMSLPLLPSGDPGARLGELLKRAIGGETV